MSDKKKHKIDVVVKDDQVEDKAGGEAPKEKKQEVSGAPEIDLDALRAQVEGILKERDEYLTMLKQVSADFDNYKKRNAQLRTESAQEAKREVIAAVLPIVDNLERALEAARGGESEALTTGVDMVVRQFLKALGDLGVEEVASQAGTVFDPALHNAVVTAPADAEHPDNTVFDTLQKGYRMGDKVIRYAMVRVAKDG